MSNSNLVTYINITKNKTSPRKSKIDTITIHCYVGQVTAKEGCNYFASTNRKCSANYVIGYDGSIGLSVEEKDRSWCSSNSDNDDRAITIEVASDIKTPYTVTDKAYKALINLVADICVRNDINKLVWSYEKSDRINHRKGCNMTVHRDFATKACPGDYLYEKHSDIAEKVNQILAQYAESNKEDLIEKIPDVYYRACTNKWWSEVKNYNTKNSEGYAGVQGKSMTALAVKASIGTIKYRVHLKGGKWLPWITSYDVENAVTGYAGIKGKEIDAVQMILEGTDKYAIKYRVSSKGSKSWYSWYTNLDGGSNDGYAGKMGQAIDCIQMEIVKK